MDHYDTRKQDSKKEGIEGLRWERINIYFMYSIVTVIVEKTLTFELEKESVCYNMLMGAYLK